MRSGGGRSGARRDMRPRVVLTLGDSHTYGESPWAVPYTLRGVQELWYRVRGQVPPLIWAGTLATDATTASYFHRHPCSGTDAQGGASIRDYLDGTDPGTGTACKTVDQIWTACAGAVQTTPTVAIVQCMLVDLLTDGRSEAQVLADLNTLVGQLLAKSPTMRIVLVQPRLLFTGDNLTAVQSLRAQLAAGAVSGVTAYCDWGGYTYAMTVSGDATNTHPTHPSSPTTLAAWSGTWTPQTVGTQWYAGNLFRAIYSDYVQGVPALSGEDWTGL